MKLFATGWQLLVISLPTASATARMRIWRALKSLGSAALRDGAYLLPHAQDRTQALRDLGEECIREGGSAWLMAVLPGSAEEAAGYEQLFDRADQYAELRSSWKEARRTLATLSPAEVARLHKRLRRELEAVQAIDFFPSQASFESDADWIDFSRRLDTILSPDEPREMVRGIPRLDAAKYRGRTWATRRRLWVDRVASAWLIRRFIDPEAKFRWLAKPSDCPKSALGFDFDGATFTHVGDRVTFETLLASFGLEADVGLVRLGALVHALDVGSDPVAEGTGLEAIMSGARERLADDDALLAQMSTVFDSLHACFLHQARRGAEKGNGR